MASVKYQSYSRGKGFAPVNVQNNAVNRILQDAQRTATGLKNQADAIIEDRINIGEAKDQNFRTKWAQKDRNQDIKLGNLRQESDYATQKMRVAGERASSLYGSIANISATAAKGIADFEAAKSQTQYQTDVNEFMTNPTYRNGLLAAHDAAVLQNSASLAQANGGAVATEQLGASSVSTGRVLNSFAQFSAGQKSAIFSHKAQSFGSYLQGELSGGREFQDPLTGETFTGDQALSNGRQYQIASQQVIDSFMQDNGFYDLSPEFTAKGLDILRKFQSKGLAKAEKAEDEYQKSNTLLMNRQLLLRGQDPTAVVADLLANKHTLNRANDYDWVKTTKGVLDMVYATDSRGNYIMNEEVRQAVLNSAGWGPNGESLGSYRQLNAEFQSQARKDRISAHNDDRKIARLEADEFWERERGAFEDILDEGDIMNDTGAFNTFEKQFFEKFPELGAEDLPDSYKRIKKQITNENKAEEADLVANAQAGLVDMTYEQARSIVDDGLREDAMELVKAQEEEQYGGNYEDLQKSLSGYAKQLTGSDLASDGMSPMARVLIPELNADFKKYYDAEIDALTAGGKLEVTPQDYAVAQQKALQQLQQDVADGLLGTDLKAKYRRSGTAKNNLYEFPNLNLEENAQQARQKYQGAIKSYQAIGERAFDSPSLILETKDLQTITDKWRRMGVLDVPAEVMKLSQISGELPVDIINRQIRSRGDDRFEELKPPEAYYKMKGQNPEVVQLFHNARTTTQRLRALQQVPEFSNKGGSDDFSYFTNSVAGVESMAHGGYNAFNTGGANGGRTPYGSGDSSKDMRFGKPISQLTLGEIKRYQNSGQLHATGRYQFIGVTLREVQAGLGLPDNTVFSPEVQDQFLMERLRQRASFGVPLYDALTNEWVGLQRIKQDNPAEYGRIVETAERLLYGGGNKQSSSGQRQRVYTTGNIGPTSRGPHLDLKMVGGGRFELSALDDYVEVDDPEFGTVSLSQLRALTNNVGDSFDEHVARGSHGWDVGTYSGTGMYLKNGAEVVSIYPTVHGNLLTFRIPTGEQFTALHGE